ncbi:hypothetical protein BXZ70DRAFT_112910 [Cristinia sonorae]|uniref:Uncharacterized protein n=1 Tax=Cristinia sonorae TaxID=1940300 RepID=A0A8K0UQE5_9AGAR|nr:hypothetical protein BXZ70DRAFT_112910 [Cristinia sonorae]
MNPYQQGHPIPVYQQTQVPRRFSETQLSAAAHSQHAPTGVYQYQSTMPHLHHPAAHYVPQHQQPGPAPNSEPIRPPAIGAFLVHFTENMRSFETHVTEDLRQLDAKHTERLTQLEKSMQERQVQMDKKMQEVVDAVISTRETGQHEMRQLATWLETSHRLQAKVLGQVCDRVQRMENSVGVWAAPVASGSEEGEKKSLIQRMDSIECLLYEALEKSNDPFASAPPTRDMATSPHIKPVELPVRGALFPLSLLGIAKSPSSLCRWQHPDIHSNIQRCPGGPFHASKRLRGSNG